ncbi:serine/threonine protein kinase [Actinomadura craniellae]|uniref:Serine/threonine protein kinase n=1 Tax=Actinomadura craniellae TaxID=2231787 RepID=A0A365GXR1_9ACTN|nr:serine/threonine-protein kinase [Actinomadura craniellae]RAY11606.1 serine/threonine protein kinase [Actinomadura craniellae]
MPEAAPLEPTDPRSLGQFEVLGRLGAGGQGAVYLGRDRQGEYVAIKLLHAQMATDPAARARFVREVSAAQKVAPFCTARVLEADVQGDKPYIVSEFIDGPSLHDVISQNGPLGPAELEQLAIGTVTALAAIHEAGIVHRDFKPNNVLLASDGPRVVDFGIARTVNSQESAVTATGMVVGTPGYLAPEQLTGAPLMPTVDIFAWGATMVFAATGQSPFEADALPAIINAILNKDPDLSALQSPLREVVGQCLNKDPGQRPQAPQLLLQLLGHVGAAPASPAPAHEELLGQGTRIAAQLPAPPPVRPQPQPQAPTPPPQPMTPPPMPMYQGPSTPPPQPMTPQPMPMYQGPATPPPMHQQRPMTPQPFPQQPPGRQGGGSTGPVIAAVGCLLVLLLVLVVVVVAVAANQGDDDPDPFPTYPTFSAPSIPSFTPFGGSGVHPNFSGTWEGRGLQTGGTTMSWTAEFTMYSSLTSGRVTYSNGSDCRGLMSLQPGGTSYKVSYRVTIISGTCINVHVTFYYISSTTLRFEERRNESDSLPLASGTLTKE